MLPGAVIFAVLLASCAGTGNVKELEPKEQETVVILHGLGRGASAMWLLSARIEDAGHIPHFEHPEVVNPLLIAFFEQHP